MKYAKLILATTALLSMAIMPVRADEAATAAAVDMAVTGFVYTTVCKPSDAVVRQLANVVALYMNAAGIDFNDGKFTAAVTIKATNLRHEVRQDPNFCKEMAAAFEKGRQEGQEEQ
jgi:cell division protein ZapA (FtsZ GTPase activity inhibitor)